MYKKRNNMYLPKTKNAATPSKNNPGNIVHNYTKNIESINRMLQHPNSSKTSTIFQKSFHIITKLNKVKTTSNKASRNTYKIFFFLIFGSYATTRSITQLYSQKNLEPSLFVLNKQYRQHTCRIKNNIFFSAVCNVAVVSSSWKKLQQWKRRTRKRKNKIEFD